MYEVIADYLSKNVVFISAFLTLLPQALKSLKESNFIGVSSFTVVVGFIVSLSECKYAFITNADAFQWSKSWNLLFSGIIFALWIPYCGRGTMYAAMPWYKRCCYSLLNDSVNLITFGYFTTKSQRKEMIEILHNRSKGDLITNLYVLQDGKFKRVTRTELENVL